MRALAGSSCASLVTYLNCLSACSQRGYNIILTSIQLEIVMEGEMNLNTDDELFVANLLSGIERAIRKQGWKHRSELGRSQEGLRRFWPAQSNDRSLARSLGSQLTRNSIRQSKSTWAVASTSRAGWRVQGFALAWAQRVDSERHRRVEPSRIYYESREDLGGTRSCRPRFPSTHCGGGEVVGIPLHEWPPN